MSKLALSIIALCLGLLLFVGPIQAQESVFGQIEAPVGVAAYNEQAEGGIGLLIFVSNVIKIVSIVAGIWTMWNFVSAGFTYITAAGDSGAYSKIGGQLSYSVMGLLLIVASYTIAGVISLLVFGDATYIINPDIPTVVDTPTGV